MPTNEHVSLKYWVLRLRTENFFFSENFLTQKSFSQSEKRTMFFTSEKNSSSNQSSEQCFFPREEKNGTSNQKPQRCLGALSGASSLCVRDEVFWTEDLIEKTTKRLHDSYTILTLIEHDMSARLNCSLPNLVPRVFVSYYTCWVSERRRRE